MFSDLSSFQQMCLTNNPNFISKTVLIFCLTVQIQKDNISMFSLFLEIEV